MSLPSATATATVNVPLPPGSIISYMGKASTLANLKVLGWLQCDGTSLTISAYQDLYNAIGTTYGGDGVSTFCLPNLLGSFLRNVDPNGTQDPDYQKRLSPIIYNTEIVGPVVGSRQLCQVQNHQHNWDQNFGQITKSGNDLNVQLSLWSPNGGNQGTQPTTNNDGGGAETRPFNVYAYFLIYTGLPQMSS